MSAHPCEPPSAECGLRLYERLCTEDSLASSEFAELYFPTLAAWLRGRNRRVSEDAVFHAAGEAVMSLIYSPRSYDPGRGDLMAYLRMSARADLRNLLRREGRHHRGRTSLESVEHSPDAGKYLGREDDPSRGLRRAEEKAELRRMLPESFFAEGDEVERTFLRLLLAGEKRTRAYIEACGMEHLSKEEQTRWVNRRKDRWKKRLKRARGGDA